MTRLGYLTVLLSAAAFLHIAVYAASDGFECDTPQGEACSWTADVSGVLYWPLLVATLAAGVAVLVRRARG